MPHQQYIEVIKHSLDVLQILYVLPGKFETNDLENCFSSYRQMSGVNYNVSVMQILDSEKKIRVRRYLGITSAKYGKVNLSISAPEDVNIQEEMSGITVSEDLLNSITSDYLSS